MVMSINIEGMSAANQLLLTEMCYNPDLAFVSDSIAHQVEKYVMEAIPKTQHRPIDIKINYVIGPRNVPFRRQCNLKKADWPKYANDKDKCMANARKL